MLTLPPHAPVGADGSATTNRDRSVSGSIAPPCSQGDVSARVCRSLDRAQHERAHLSSASSSTRRDEHASACLRPISRRYHDVAREASELPLPTETSEE